jgi:hypothetical protein
MMHGNVVFILLGIAGVASTFGGFAGVVVTFTRRAEGEWLGLFCAAYFAYAMPRRRRLQQSRPWVLRKWMSVVMIIGIVSAFVLQVLNAAGAIVERGAGPYVVGLVLLLTISGFQFALMVLPSLSSTER